MDMAIFLASLLFYVLTSIIGSFWLAPIVSNETEKIAMRSLDAQQQGYGYSVDNSNLPYLTDSDFQMATQLTRG